MYALLSYTLETDEQFRVGLNISHLDRHQVITKNIIIT